MCLVLGKDNTESMRWWIDASYAVHPNMRRHTGATMSMGNGSIYSGSWKQKMVTRSSTESEVVGVYDVLPQILWIKKFLEDQGLTIKETVLYQDNMSSMLLERNWRQSSTKPTKHMDIWYFYVGDHIQNKTLSLKHCPTEEMLANYFTKSLQGVLYSPAFIITSWELSLPMDILKLIGVCWTDDDHDTHIWRHPNGTRRHPNGTRGASERDQEASERDQNENKQNFPPRDHNDENARDAVIMYHGKHTTTTKEKHR